MTIKTKQEIVEEVKGWFENTSEVAQQEFLETPFDELARYHHSVGRTIRNEFDLWKAKWDENIVDGVDCSKGHPDALSMNIIETVWAELHESN
jgi:hypothetical protein